MLDTLAGQLNQESVKIQIELERLKMRRRMIEEQRRALCAASPNTSTSHQGSRSTSHNLPLAVPARPSTVCENNNNNNNNASALLLAGGGGRSASSAKSQYTVHSACGHRSSSVASAGELTNVVTHPGDLPPGGTRRHPIPGELPRRKRCERSAHYQMKEAIREALEHDSCVVGGGFMPNPHTSKQGTFGRAARFAVPIGKVNYYLSYDVQQLQGPNCKGDRRVLTASCRGRAGTNVNSHWNDAKGGVAPGPGAYTPRTWFLSNITKK